MADKELRKMNRTELIEIIYALQQNERALREENETLRTQLDDKLLRIEKAGSIAEAALSLNRIFEDAEQAAQQYLASIQKANDTAEQILEDARREADAIRAQAAAEAKAQAATKKAEQEKSAEPDGTVEAVIQPIQSEENPQADAKPMQDAEEKPAEPDETAEPAEPTDQSTPKQGPGPG
ncbi:MAG: hypothetical protein LUF68_02600, partial [Clostridiales bacterium]|nr:hypothetical protein [Clostridiales bacterium]